MNSEVTLDLPREPNYTDEGICRNFKKKIIIHKNNLYFLLFLLIGKNTFPHPFCHCLIQGSAQTRGIVCKEWS